MRDRTCVMLRPSGYRFGMDTLVIVLATVAVVALVVWFIATRRHPESAASHLPEDERRGARLDRLNERPGSPGAEGQAVVGRGAITAGPGEGPSTGDQPREPLLPE